MYAADMDLHLPRLFVDLDFDAETNSDLDALLLLWKSDRMLYGIASCSTYMSEKLRLCAVYATSRANE